MGLNWAQWSLIGLSVFSVVFSVATVGQKREPRSPFEATVGLILNGIVVFLVVKAGS